MEDETEYETHLMTYAEAMERLPPRLQKVMSIGYYIWYTHTFPEAEANKATHDEEM